MTDEDFKSIVAGSNLAILEIMRMLYEKKIFRDEDWNYLIQSLSGVAEGDDLKPSQQDSIFRVVSLLGRFHPNESMRLKSK